jgi:hypothetical protein
MRLRIVGLPFGQTMLASMCIAMHLMHRTIKPNAGLLVHQLDFAPSLNMSGADQLRREQDREEIENALSAFVEYLRQGHNLNNTSGHETLHSFAKEVDNGDEYDIGHARLWGFDTPTPDLMATGTMHQQYENTAFLDLGIVSCATW